MLTVKQKLDELGYAVVENVFDHEACDQMANEMDCVAATSGRRQGGVRDLFTRALRMRMLVRDHRMRSLVEPVITDKAFAVRAIFFHKTAYANWAVSWHRDLTIAVKEKASVPGFGPWSFKDGVVHVQPTEQVLASMLTIRIHLDAATERNGALWVMPGTHRLAIGVDRPSGLPSCVCEVGRGGVVAMRPLLWHKSAKASVAGHRRVIHIEFAAASLPGPLEWREQW